jgi:hypothetical protein
MKAALQRIKSQIWHFDENDNQINGPHKNIQGNVSGIWGNVSGIQGNIDDCEITDAERAAGIEINQLVAE